MNSSDFAFAKNASSMRNPLWTGVATCLFALLVSICGVVSLAQAPTGSQGILAMTPGVVPPADEHVASHPVGVCGTRHFEPRMEFCDTRNNHLYRFVTIGTQTWMAEFLDYGTMVHGDADQTSPGQKYCQYDKESDCGALYQWAEAMGLDPSFNAKIAGLKGKVQGICPSGWHIPSESEWNTLLTLVKKEQGQDNQTVSLLGYSPNDDFRWKTNTDPDSMLPTKDKYGFSVLSVGYRVLQGTCGDGPQTDSYFCNAHDMEKFWTSDDSNSDSKTAVSITFIEDVPQVIDSSKKPEEFLAPEMLPKMIESQKAHYANQTEVQHRYKDAQKYQGMSIRCLKD